MGEKNLEREKETRKNPCLVALIPASVIWRPTVFQCLRSPKTSQTYPKWEGDLI